MNRLMPILAAFLFIALGVPAVAQAQGFTVDPAAAKRGQTVWQRTGCMVCHTLGGGQGAGPDLVGVHERRSLEWLTRWLKYTTEMLETDSIAKDMLVEYKNIKMPNMKLNDRDINAVIHYIARETEERRGK